jgi:xanthine dehydrogenase YagR molybdenum-binding subunit
MPQQPELGDSSYPPAPVAGGSNTTASSCSAVMKACDAIRAKLAHVAVTSGHRGKSPVPLHRGG